MKKNVPRIHVHSAEDDLSSSKQSASNITEADIPDSPDDVPVVSAFLVLDILDEFGEADRVSLPDRVGKFLNAIYNRVVTEANIRVEGKTQDQVQDYLSTKWDDQLASELLQNFQVIFRLYVPEERNSASRPIEMYWGAVYEIAEVKLLGPYLLESADAFLEIHQD